MRGLGSDRWAGVVCDRAGGVELDEAVVGDVDVDEGVSGVACLGGPLEEGGEVLLGDDERDKEAGLGESDHAGEAASDATAFGAAEDAVTAFASGAATVGPDPFRGAPVDGLASFEVDVGLDGDRLLSAGLGEVRLSRVRISGRDV